MIYLKNANPLYPENYGDLYISAKVKKLVLKVTPFLLESNFHSIVSFSKLQLIIQIKPTGHSRPAALYFHLMNIFEKKLISHFELAYSLLATNT